VKSYQTTGTLLSPTKDDIEGPFYLAGAPFKRNIVPEGTAGEPLTLSGGVFLLDSNHRVATPVPDAELDFWQADKDGRYDNQDWEDPHEAPPEHVYLFRGKQLSEKNGVYLLETIKPGHYPINDALTEFRTSHIHAKVRIKDRLVLTTQLYFPGDPFNRTDHWYSQVLEITDKEIDDQGVKKLIGQFNFYLLP